jgi:hypothetical protein
MRLIKDRKYGSALSLGDITTEFLSHQRVPEKDLVKHLKKLCDGCENLDYD